jgi:hypothetical protein
MNPGLAQFRGRRYLNLESYRKSGKAVRTPLWFAESDGALYAYTWAGSGKVKRIRREPRVRVVPSDFHGNPKGEWLEARAELLEGEAAARGHELLRRKYWLKRLFDLLNRLQKRRHAVMALRLL